MCRDTGLLDHTLFGVFVRYRRLLEERWQIGFNTTMAPPSFLGKILSNFGTIHQHVLNESGRNVRLVKPRGMSVCLGKYFRVIVGRTCEEASRVSSYLCCAEDLKFVGTLLRGSSSCLSMHIGGERVRLLELYVGSSGRAYLYAMHPGHSTSVCVAAASVRDLVRRGIRVGLRCYPKGPPSDERALSLSRVRSFTDAVAWRTTHLGATVTVGDGSIVRVCDMFYTKYGIDALEYWAKEAGVTKMEILAVVVFAPRAVGITECDSRVVILVDEDVKVYAAGGSGKLVRVAGDLEHLVSCGLCRYGKNILFYGESDSRRLSVKPPCPNGVDHGYSGMRPSRLENSSQASGSASSGGARILDLGMRIVRVLSIRRGLESS